MVVPQFIRLVKDYVQVLFDRIGGQVNDTRHRKLYHCKRNNRFSILANLVAHIEEYDIDTMTGIRATNIEKTDQAIRVTLENNAVLETKTAIISTGASGVNLTFLVKIA